MLSAKTHLASGFKWILAGTIVQRLLSVVAMAVLARRLEPSVFGVFALAFAAIDGLAVFQNLGLNSAIIQARELTDDVVNTVFTIIAATGVGISVVCFAIAPWVGVFFGDPEVVGVLRLLSPLFIIGSLSRVPNALLGRRLMFRSNTIINVVGGVVNSVLSIVLVLASPTIWSLVAAYLIKQCVTTCLYLAVARYRPRFQLHIASARGVLRYGQVMFGIGLVSYLWQTIDNLLLGRVLGTALVGYFVLATNIGDLANRYVATVIGDLMFPVLSRIQADPEQLRRAYRRTTGAIGLVTVPFGCGLVLFAEPLVEVLYGAKWAATVPLIRVFGGAAVVATLTSCSSSVFRAMGRPQYDLYLTLGKLAFRIPALVLLSTWLGLLGASIAGAGTVLLFTIPTLSVTRRVLGTSYGELLSGLWSAVRATSVMIGATLLARWAAISMGAVAAELSTPGAGVVLGGVATVTYIGALVWFDRPLVSELWSVAVSRGRE